ncbi:MAG: DoxX family protein [Bacteroidetes bacterium]|nr:DoxX family protein [Bacteroidota bacterium]
MLQKFVTWLDTYREVAFDLLRIYLGVGLFVRGVLFFYDPVAITAMLPPDTPAWVASGGLLNVVALVHIVGGALIAVGFWTRIAALTQVPILFAAVFLSVAGLFSADQSFEFSTLVLFLVLLVFIYGSGRWSVEYYWKRDRLAIQKLFDKLYEYRETAFDVLRIYLGLGLFVRGVLFIADSGNFIELLSPDSGALLRSTLIVHYVALAHVFGGTMMVAGLLTRVAALVQIPVLVGAVFVSQLQGGLLTANQSFEFSTLVLFMLILVFLYGSGKWSADYYLFKRKAAAEAEEARRTELAAEILTHEVPEEEAFADPIGTLAVPEVKTAPATIEELRDDPMVLAQARYSFWGWFLFLADVTPRPKEIVFRNIRTGKIIKRSKDPAVLEQFRYQ